MELKMTSNFCSDAFPSYVLGLQTRATVFGLFCARVLNPGPGAYQASSSRTEPCPQTSQRRITFAAHCWGQTQCTPSDRRVLRLLPVFAGSTAYPPHLLTCPCPGNGHLGNICYDFVPASLTSWLEHAEGLICRI